jgi:glycosyltransferase involved in cell wall biosynthesis
MKLRIFFLHTFVALLWWNSIRTNYDLTIVGSIKFADGLGRLPITFIDMHKDNLKINFIHTHLLPISFDDVPLGVQEVVKNSDKTPGNVSMICEQLWLPFANPSLFVPNSKIKIALSMIEATSIPQQWVDILNSKFDLVVVPDEFLVKVYSEAGVMIPIFELPLPLYLEEFLDKPLKKKANKIFTFGYSSRLVSDKNYLLLAQAFSKEFGNSPKVQLLMHGRGGALDPEMKKLLKEHKNIHMIQEVLSHQRYVDFMASLDCYVLLSKGEGFSIGPREALALGIPAIISNNTAHMSICKTGLVEPFNTPIQEKAYFPIFQFHCGYKFNGTLAAACQALRKVYNNYKFYLSQALQRREWAKQYLRTNLSSRVLSLIKPKQVILGTVNSIDKDYLMTTSEVLYQKYISIIKPSEIT